MKYIYSIIIIVFVGAVSAQEQKKNDQLFDNWFANQPNSTVPVNAAPPPPPNSVPIDGGLIGLIAAGGALGYKKYKQRAESAE